MKSSNKKGRGFWSTADTFNIVDALSIFFSIIYLIIVIGVILKPDKPNLLVLQENMNIPMMTILGGYFGDQIVSRVKGGNKDLASRFKDIKIPESSGDKVTDETFGGYASEDSDSITMGGNEDD